MGENCRRSVAIHEAGHAVVAMVHGARLDEAEILPNGRGGVEFLTNPYNDTLGVVKTRHDGLRLMALHWAGAAAEMRAGYRDTWGWGGDASFAIDLLRFSDDGVWTKAEEAFVARYRPGRTKITPELMMTLFKRFGVGARAIVREHWAAVVAIADLLEQHGVLTGDAMHDVFDRHLAQSRMNEAA